MIVRKLRVLLWNFLICWEKPFFAFILAFIIYTLLASLNGIFWFPSENPFYNYLADAFLHKQLFLRDIPLQSTHDLVLFGGHYYLYWPPLPAILMMPLIAIFGVNFSDIFFTIIVSAVNVCLVAELFRRANKNGMLDMTVIQRALLVVFFALGTVHVTLAPLGRVWFTGQVIGFLFTVLAFLISICLRGWKSFAFTGLFVACATLTRNHLLFIGIWPAYYLIIKHLNDGWKKILGYIIIGIFPLGVALLFNFSYNWLRFGNVLDVGLNYHQMAEIFVKDYHQYGAFNLHYLPKNFFYQYLAYPFPLRSETFMGGSLFLLSPVFFLAFWGVIRGRPRISIFFLLMTITAISTPIILLMGTGWVQFGPRYSLDFTMPLIMLTAMGIRYWSDSITTILVIISIIHYISGYWILMHVI